jgi:hypothetical protein
MVSVMVTRASERELIVVYAVVKDTMGDYEISNNATSDRSEMRMWRIGGRDGATKRIHWGFIEKDERITQH